MRVGRDMHWLRIDRYYSSGIEEKYKEVYNEEPTSQSIESLLKTA